MPSDIHRLRRDRGDWQDSELARELTREVDGAVGFDRGTRALYAADASNYRQPPLGVVVPRTIDALVTAVAICRAHGAPIVGRGGGTSLAGQTANHAVVIDCSRWLHRCEVDRASATVFVEPGVIMKAMRDAANAVGLDFGPDPSTHDRCTLGGMLGNNSCGVHSVMGEFYGPGARTSDHVVDLDVLTYDGVRMRVGATDDVEHRRLRDLGGRAAAIVDGLAALRDRHAAEIRARFPKMPRNSAGYNLPALLPEHGFHLARALVGSEATCTMFLGATLQLMPARPERALVVIGFPDIFAAGAAACAARERRPVGCEAFDDTLHDRLVNQHKDPHRALELLPEGRSWLLIEHGATTMAEAKADAEETARRIRGTGVVIYTDPDPIEALRELREQALGVDAFATGRPDTYEGWEDSSVHPEKLEGYLRELRGLYDQFGYQASLYGHFGQGCVHTRIDFDLKSEAGLARYRAFTDAAAKLVTSYGGSLSGEHGDGQSKAELHEIMYGAEIVEAFREFKTIWDPDHRMNPGKVVWPNSRTDDIRLFGYPGAANLSGEIQLVHGPDGKDFGHAAVRCVGIGKCRKLDAGTMCPSYMVTLDEKHSTRGRAHLLFEMMKGELITDGWRSEEVRESLDLCLACKACKHECPTGVDMASYKAEFNAHHYAGRVRPRAQYAFGWLPRWLTIMRPLAPLANWAAKAPGLGSLIKWLADVSPEREIPHLARRSFRRTFEPPEAPPGARRVLLWPDTFNDAFYPEVLHATVDVLTHLGFAVDIPRKRLCCARPMIEYGMLDPARAMWRETLDELTPEIADGTLVLGVEPSCTTTFRDELASLFPGDPRARKLAAQTVTLAELFDRERLPVPASALSGAKTLYQHHCHQHAILSPDLEVKALRDAGLDVTELDAGCCGMAGAFGFQRDKYALSVALAERVLLPAIRANPDAVVVADGFSCREQLRQLAGVRPLHLAEILADRLPPARVREVGHEPPPPPRAPDPELRR